MVSQTPDFLSYNATKLEDQSELFTKSTPKYDAKSGTKAFEEALTAGADIPRIGVDIYSTHLVADKAVSTPEHNDNEQYRNQIQKSNAGESFKIATVHGEPLGRNTKIVPYMKEDQMEVSEEKKIKEISKKHPQFIDYPIKQITKKVVRKSQISQKRSFSEGEGINERRGEGFVNQNRLVAHMKEHGEVSFNCDICIKELLLLHIRQKHNSYQQRKSDQKRNHQLETRQFKVSDANEEDLDVITCKVCPQRFYQKASYKDHRNSEHRGIMVKCEYCDSDYSTRSGSNQHKTSKHSQALKCSHCDIEVESKEDPENVSNSDKEGM